MSSMCSTCTKLLLEEILEKENHCKGGSLGDYLFYVTQIQRLPAIQAFLSCDIHSVLVMQRREISLLAISTRIWISGQKKQVVFEKVSAAIYPLPRKHLKVTSVRRKYLGAFFFFSF